MYKISWHKKKLLSNYIVLGLSVLNYEESSWKLHHIEILTFNAFKNINCNNFHCLLWKTRKSSLLFTFKYGDYLYMNYISISVNKFTDVIIDSDLNVFMCCILL
jgi:hypothetical protein